MYGAFLDGFVGYGIGHNRVELKIGRDCVEVRRGGVEFGENCLQILGGEMGGRQRTEECRA